MKTVILNVSIVFMSFVACGQDSSYSYSGTFADVKSGTLLMTHAIAGKYVTDSVTVRDGRFTFSGFAADPVSARLYWKRSVPARPGAYDFFLEPGKFVIAGSGEKLGELKIVGTSFTGDNAELARVQQATNAKMELIGKLYAEASKNDNKVTLDSLDQLEKPILREKRQAAAEFIKSHPASLVSPLAILQEYSAGAEADDVEPLYNQLSPKVKLSGFGKKVKEMLDVYKNVAVGKVLPEISQPDTAGKPISLSSVKSKYRIVDFWASWCRPCRAENPNLVALYKKYHAKGLEIYAVSYDSEKGKKQWVKAIDDDQLPWLHVSELKGWQNSTSAQFYIKSMPANIIVDETGRIVAKNLFGEALTAKMAELMP